MVALPWGQPKAPALTTNKCTETEKMAQMKEKTKALEKIQLSDEEIANLSDAQFKTLVIRMLTEMVEYGRKIEEKVKAMQSEIKENVQGTKVKGRKLELKSMVWTEGRNKHPTRTE